MHIHHWEGQAFATFLPSYCGIQFPHDYKYFLELDVLKVTIPKHSFWLYYYQAKQPSVPLWYLLNLLLLFSISPMIWVQTTYVIVILLSQNTQSNPNSMFTIVQEYLILCLQWCWVFLTRKPVHYFLSCFITTCSILFRLQGLDQIVSLLKAFLKAP